MSNLIYKNRQYLNDDALENVVAYALRTDKDDLNNPIQRISWGGQDVITRTPQSAIDGFNAVKKYIKKMMEISCIILLLHLELDITISLLLIMR